MKTKLSVILTLVAGATSQATIVTWDGEGADNDWGTVANWVGDALPGSANDANFDDGASAVVSDAQSANKVLLSQGGGETSDLTIQSSGSLTVGNGGVWIGNNNLTTAVGTLNVAGTLSMVGKTIYLGYNGIGTLSATDSADIDFGQLSAANHTSGGTATLNVSGASADLAGWR